MDDPDRREMGFEQEPGPGTTSSPLGRVTFPEATWGVLLANTSPAMLCQSVVSPVAFSCSDA